MTTQDRPSAIEADRRVDTPSRPGSSALPEPQNLPELSLPQGHNYVAVFLTLACNLDCSYCINLHEDGSGGRRRILTRHLRPEDWIRAFDRIPTTHELPITLQGGEPTVYKKFIDIVSGAREGTHFDLLTNMFFDAKEFVRRVPVSRFDRNAPYAPIRVSYHPNQNTMREIIEKSLYLQEHGFRVGIYGVLHPSQRDEILRWQERATDLGLDFRTKEFLGVEEGSEHGTYRYPGAINGEFNKFCECRTTELLIAPSGYVFRCHSDLYEARSPVGHILDPDFSIDTAFKPCLVFGHCNPCDVKVKTNRFQKFGHTSVEIRSIRDLSSEEEARLESGDNGVREVLGPIEALHYPTLEPNGVRR